MASALRENSRWCIVNEASASVWHLPFAYALRSQLKGPTKSGAGVGLVAGNSVCDDGLRKGKVPKEYVRMVEGAYRVDDTRVSLDSLVYLFREGMSAESMVESYPALTLEQVHGALAFYLANQDEIDAYLAEGHRAAEFQHQQSRRTNAELIAKLQRARSASQIPG